MYDVVLYINLKKKIYKKNFCYSDDPLDKDLYHALLHEDKVCDVISKWETALREKGMGKFENNRVIRFVYQNRLFWRKNISSEVERERLLFAYQISKQIVQGKFPINKELAFELTALMAQVCKYLQSLLNNVPSWVRFPKEMQNTKKNRKFLITEISIYTNRINFINFFLLFF